MPKFIPYGRHLIDDSDILAVENVLRSDWLTCGSQVELFEEKLCKEVDSHYAVACSNGTTALHLALLALDIGVGDKVIVPAITFLATANAVRYVGADLIFADIDPNTGLMTPETLRQAIVADKDINSIKAIINVHLAGQCEDLEAIYKISKEYDLFIIEDAAHAIGTCYIDQQGTKYPVGSNKFSDLTTFSFHPVKTIATGEGGAITTNNIEYAKKMRCLRSHGMLKEPDDWVNLEQGFDNNQNINNWYYEMLSLGYNYRISDINCALGSSQLLKLNSFKKERHKLVLYYDNMLENHAYIKPLKKLKNSDTAWHLYILQINFEQLGKTRTQVMQDLKNNGVGTQVHYIPVYKQPYYKNLYGEIKLYGAEKYYYGCLSLPLYVGLKIFEQDKIVKELITL